MQLWSLGGGVPLQARTHLPGGATLKEPPLSAWWRLPSGRVDQGAPRTLVYLGLAVSQVLPTTFRILTDWIPGLPPHRWANLSREAFLCSSARQRLSGSPMNSFT